MVERGTHTILELRTGRKPDEGRPRRLQALLVADAVKLIHGDIDYFRGSTSPDL